LPGEKKPENINLLEKFEENKNNLTEKILNKNSILNNDEYLKYRYYT